MAHARDMRDVRRFSRAAANLVAAYRHTETTETELNAELAGLGERTWTVETAAGPLSVKVLRFCNTPDIASVFMRFDDVKQARALGLPGLNQWSGKWNIHEVDAVGREALEDRALHTLRARLERVGAKIECGPEGG